MHLTPPLSKETRTSRPRALVIDDDPLFRSLVVSMLKRDYDVSAATDGKEGFYRALEHVPDIAVIDIQMPVWDGLRTLQAFREHSLLQGVGILMLTSDTSRETVMAAITGGADEYVIKTSLSREELLQKMSHIRSRTLQSTSAGSPGLDLAGETSAAELLCARSSEQSRLQEVLDTWE